MSVDARRNAFGHIISYKVRLRDEHGKFYGDLFEVRDYDSPEATRLAAEQWEEAEKAKKKKGVKTGPRLFQDVAAEWLQSDKTKSDTAFDKDEGNLRLHINPVFGDTPIRHISTAEIEKFIKDLVAAGKANETVRRIYSTMRAVFSFAWKKNYMLRHDDPCSRVDPKKMPAKESRKLRVDVVREVVEGDDYSFVMDLDPFWRVGGHMGDYSLMIDLGLTGLRWCEVAGIWVQDLKLDSKYPSVTINRTVTRKVQRETGERWKPKAKSHRTTDQPQKALSPQLAALLAELVKDKGPTDWVFPAAEGGPLSYDNWRRDCWEPAAQSAELYKVVGFHDTKHVATKLLEHTSAGDKIKEHRLGNSRVVQLSNYDEVTAAEDRRVAREQGNLVYGGQRAS